MAIWSTGWKKRLVDRIRASSTPTARSPLSTRKPPNSRTTATQTLPISTRPGWKTPLRLMERTVTLR